MTRMEAGFFLVSMPNAANQTLLRLTLCGRFAVTAADGRDLTPKSNKAQGLLALLATSPDLTRTRRWLEDMLWSDRAPEQAAGSLRQALADVRRTLGPALAALQSDRQKVWLRREAVTVDTTSNPQAELLEGLDIRDPAFESWLRAEQLQRMTARPLTTVQVIPPAPRQTTMPPIRRPDWRHPVVVLHRLRNGTEAPSLMEDLFIDCAALSLREALGIAVFTQTPKPPQPNTIEVAVQSFAVGPAKHLRLRAVELDSGRLLWSGQSGAIGKPGALDDVEIIHFANQVVEVLGDALTLRPHTSGATDALALQRLAVRKLWSMDPARMAEAETLLAVSDQIAPRGLISAWRAQLRVFRLIERHSGDPQTLRAEAFEFCRQALEREPNNSMVLAVVAYARSTLDRTPLAAAELARRSVAMNPNNPLAWDSLSIAKMFAGQLAEAHELALKVQRMGALTPNKFWWDMGLCITATVTRQEALAARMAESSLAQAPDFRAALRYVVALNAGMGNEAIALAAAQKLQSVDPSFTLDAMAHDPSYPVESLRGSGLLQSDRIRDLPLAPQKPLN